MILINTPSFISTSADTQTPMKLDQLVVNYSTALGQKDGVPQGYINSYLCTVENSFVHSIPQIEIEVFTGNILSDLHNIYITYLTALNPKLKFTSTL
jgi:hypothetical protein